LIVPQCPWTGDQAKPGSVNTPRQVATRSIMIITILHVTAKTAGHVLVGKVLGDNPAISYPRWDVKLYRVMYD
jgi:hypothetical protein